MCEHETYRETVNGMHARRDRSRRSAWHACESLRAPTTGAASATLVVRPWSCDVRPGLAAPPALCYAPRMAAKTPEECDTLFERHMNAGDLDALANLYETDAVLVPNPGELVAGREAIREALGAFVAAKVQLHLRVSQVLRAGDDLAMLYGDWSGHFTDPDGARVEIAGQSVEVVRRQADGTWRFALDDPYGRG